MLNLANSSTVCKPDPHLNKVMGEQLVLRRESQVLARHELLLSTCLTPLILRLDACAGMFHSQPWDTATAGVSLYRRVQKRVGVQMRPFRQSSRSGYILPRAVSGHRRYPHFLHYLYFWHASSLSLQPWLEYLQRQWHSPSACLQ